MKYDHKIERMPGHDYPYTYDKDEKMKRIWQVVMIERDNMGAPVKDLNVMANNLTYDEALSAANKLNIELREAERKSVDKSS